MSTIPTSLFASTTLTVVEAAERLHLRPSTVYTYIREGLIPGTRRMGRLLIVPLAAIERLKALGSDVVRAQLFHAANERATNGIRDPEIEAKEASVIAKHRSAIATARLRKTREQDLAELTVPEPDTANNMDESLPEITDREILKLSVTVGAISHEPFHRWNDDQMRELFRVVRRAEGRGFMASVPGTKQSLPTPNTLAQTDPVSFSQSTAALPLFTL